MAHQLSRDDFEFLRRAHELAQRGRTQAEIAAELGMRSAGHLHSRVLRLGYRIVSIPTSEIRDPRTGRTIDELISSGDLVPGIPEAVP